MFNFSRIKNKVMNLTRGIMQTPLRYNILKNETLEATLLSKEAVIIDLRSKEEYNLLHIKDSINLPNEYLRNNIMNVVPKRDSKIIVYCLTGSRIKDSISILNSMGYFNIYIWDNGGLDTFKLSHLLVR